jgi:hypothetical protein
MHSGRACADTTKHAQQVAPLPNGCCRVHTVMTSLMTLTTPSGNEAALMVQPLHAHAL